LPDKIRPATGLPPLVPLKMKRLVKLAALTQRVAKTKKVRPAVNRFGKLRIAFCHLSNLMNATSYVNSCQFQLMLGNACLLKRHQIVSAPSLTKAARV
jgi:hypothetical protein